MKPLPTLLLACAAWLHAGCLTAFANDPVIPPADMSLIPAGSFTMGRTSGDTDANAPPAITVTLSAVMIGKHEVSGALWNEVRTWAATNGYTDLRSGNSKAVTHPVQTISWFDAVKWCNARSEKEGLTPCYTVAGAVMKTGTAVPVVNWNVNGYRLPTEAEWEKAARGGVTGFRFPSGSDTISHTAANFRNIGAEAYATGSTGYHPTYATGTTIYTAPAASFAANGYGLHDMAGNVWEWCWDVWGGTYASGTTDPKGPATGDYRILRGGSWSDNATLARAANRGVNLPTATTSSSGFRVARSAIPTVTAPAITTHPAAATINRGQTATLTVAATGSAPLAFQWYQGTAGSIATPVGTNSSSFTTPALSMATNYWVRVSNSAGSVDSAAAMVTVIIPPAITGHPSSLEIWFYQSATLRVTASGSPPFGYQWYAGSSGNTSQPVGTGESFTTSSGGNYWVRVSNAAGTADSEAAAVTIMFPPPEPPLIVTQPASVTIPSDMSVTLTVASNGTTPLSYRWYQGPVGTLTTPVGSDSERFTTPALTQSTSYWVRVSNSAGTVDSAAATVAVVSSPPSIITQPVSTTALTGSTATLGVNARGSAPLAFQWYQGAAGVTTAPVGINSASFTTPALTTTASYWVRVSNSFGSVSSAAATIKVQAAAREVAIPDPILLAELRKALAKPTGPLTDLDLLTLTTLRIAGLGITDLTGLEFATNLRVLDVRRNNFTTAAALWAVLDQITPMYCLYVDVRRPGQTPYGIVAQTLTDTSGNSFFIFVDAPNLPSLDFNSLAVDAGNSSNINALQTINASGVAVETAGVNLPPSVAASATVVDHASRAVRLSAAGSSDIDGSITRYVWSWAAGSAIGFSPAVTLPYGNTPVTLTVTDDDGATGSYGLMVTLLRPYSTPVVANLTASQRAATRLVDIRYEVNAVTPAVTSGLRISSDDGNTFNVPATTLSGDIRRPFATGTGKAIVWDAGADWPEQFSRTMRFEVTADDGIGTPDGMSLIPAGSFTMGRTSGDTDSNAPPVGVNVSAFYMAKNEVTKALWDGVRTWAAANGYTDLAAGAGKASNHPVQSVSWWDAVKWCNARSEMEGLTPCYTLGAAVMKTGSTAPTVSWSANGYRLPTEAEWEKAARGGVSGMRFPWGTDTISHGQANYLASESYSYDSSAAVNNHHPAYNDGTSIYTAPVGSFAANGYGLSDMAGNVWEWCWDWYGAATYVNAATDPQGAASGLNRVIRGGSWGWNASHCRAANRSDSSPANLGYSTGFRVARSPLADVVPPTISNQPASTAVVGNSGSTLTVAAAGTSPFSYQWYQGAVGSTTHPVGANAAAFTAPAPAATTRYWVRVSNAAGSVDSIAATVDAMALVPSGTFTMGRTSADADDNAPPVAVNTYAFQIGKFEVSKALWDEVRGWALANGYTDLLEAGGKAPDHPAHGITWFDALKWCNARSEKEGLTPVYIDNRAVMKTGTAIPTVNWSADGYRLPSEAEWEKAARGGRSGLRFPWGDAITHSQANYPSSTSSSYDQSPTRGYHPSYEVAPAPFTSPIGSFAANDYGLHDTSGNVREWCWDWYDAAYYTANASDPRGPATGTNRVIRGGSSDAGAPDCRSMHRGSQAPAPAIPSAGFRVARGPLLNLTAPAIITQPASATITSGQTATLRVTAAGGTPLTYQWYQGTVGSTTTPVGTNSPNFTTPALTATTSYWLRLSNANGSLNSTLATVTIPVAPSLTTQPASTTITSGQSATLTVTAAGTAPLTYQWYQGAVGSTTSPVGTNSASFTTAALTATTSYWVRVSNSAGNVNSALATVTVNPPVIAPSITTQPASTTITSGQTATLTVTASGTAPLTYQWFQGAVGSTTSPVGTNSASFTTAALTTTTTYWVRVINSAGNVNSALATVTVVAEMALIPAGAFTMGRTSGDTDTNAPPVTVTVSAFYLGKHEVTKALWDEVRTWGAANGYTDLAAGAGKAANHPAQIISWWDVIKWCNARSQKEGLTPCYTVSGAVMKTGSTAPTVNWSANGYRLPTEAEWEKAARGGVSGKRFPWGTDTISHSQANYRASTSFSYDSSAAVNNYHPTYLTGSTPYTSPVGAFTANAYGLHDMAGNVLEWCWDWYGASTYVTGATNPRGAASGTDRVFRGGGWLYSAFNCRVADRGSGIPAVSGNSIGFRVARSSVP